MNYRVTLNGETVARFKLKEDAKFFIDAFIENGMDTTGKNNFEIIARNGETFRPAEWRV